MMNNDQELRSALRSGADQYPSVGPQAIRFIADKDRRKRRILVGALTVGTLAVFGVIFSDSARNVDLPLAGQTESQPPFLSHRAAPVQMAAEIPHTARLSSRDGCLFLNDAPLIWPEGSTWDAELQSITMPHNGGSVDIRVGSFFPSGLGGGLMPLEYAEQYLTEGDRTAAASCLGTGQDRVFMVN
jgi:hypothetical protein